MQPFEAADRPTRGATDRPLSLLLEALRVLVAPIEAGPAVRRPRLRTGTGAALREARPTSGAPVQRVRLQLATSYGTNKVNPSSSLPLRFANPNVTPPRPARGTWNPELPPTPEPPPSPPGPLERTVTFSPPFAGYPGTFGGLSPTFRYEKILNKSDESITTNRTWGVQEASKLIQ